MSDALETGILKGTHCFKVLCVMALSDYNILANICQRIKIDAKCWHTLRSKEKKSEEALSWTNTKRMHNVMNVCVAYV